MDMARCRPLSGEVEKGMQKLYKRVLDAPAVQESLRSAEKDRRKAKEIKEAADGLRRFVDAISSG